jgi:hypothetical protein
LGNSGVGGEGHEGARCALMILAKDLHLSMPDQALDVSSRMWGSMASKMSRI